MIQGKLGRYTTRVISRGARAAPHLLAVIFNPEAFALRGKREKCIIIQ